MSSETKVSSSSNNSNRKLKKSNDLYHLIILLSQFPTSSYSLSSSPKTVLSFFSLSLHSPPLCSPKPPTPQTQHSLHLLLYSLHSSPTPNPQHILFLSPTPSTFHSAPWDFISSQNHYMFPLSSGIPSSQ